MRSVLAWPLGRTVWCAVALASAVAADAAGGRRAIASRTAEAGGVKLHYLGAGRGPAVILLLEERPKDTTDALVKFL